MSASCPLPRNRCLGTRRPRPSASADASRRQWPPPPQQPPRRRGPGRPVMATVSERFLCRCSSRRRPASWGSLGQGARWDRPGQSTSPHRRDSGTAAGCTCWGCVSDGGGHEGFARLVGRRAGRSKRWEWLPFVYFSVPIYVGTVDRSHHVCTRLCAHTCSECRGCQQAMFAPGTQEV